jgi:phosphoglycolate phosphatase-like HAD superfamily hydrolase
MELKEMGFRTGILTSNSQENVTQFLIANQLEQFDVIYSGASLFGKSKVIRSALKKQNLKTTDVLYVGDETRDIDAARSAGVRIVSVSWGFNNREILSAQMPDYLIDDPNQLSKICLQIGLNR